MSEIFKKTVVIISLCMLMVVLFCSCGSEEVAKVNSPATSIPVTIEIDGKLITVEDTDGQSIEEILKDAKITITENDIISVDTNKKLSEGIVIKILRKVSVKINNSINDTEQNIVLVGSTVADALEAAGIKLADNHTTNYKSTDALEDGMEIIVSIKEAPTTTQEYSQDDSYDNDSDNDSGSSSGSNSGNNSGNNSSSGNRPNSGSNSSATKAPETTKAPAPTKAPETTSGRTVVNVDIYEDCDGSGHGVKVITYSDGTQEEVAF